MGRAWHLAKRFFQVLTARPLRPEEQREVAGWLEPAEAEIFWSQQVADQRHGLETARKLARQRPEDIELIRAGLLHDSGKAATGYGPIGRTMATLAELLNLPMTPRMRTYAEHGPVGAAKLRAAGIDGLVADFAERHPGPPAPHTDPQRWQLLLEADDD